MSAFANRHGTGSFRRRHLLVAVDDFTVAAGVEDEMHHFELTVRHDGSVVTAVGGTPVRWPWSPCYDSPNALAALVGLPLTATPADIAAWTDAREQCTHQFDLTTLAISHAARHVAGGANRRDYVTEVPDWNEAPFTARLWRDGDLFLDWTCSRETVLEPEQFRGAPLKQRFFAWCANNLDSDTAEAAQMLRRAVWLSPARKVDLEDMDDATESGLALAICYTSQAERMPVAIRSRNSLRDFSTSAAPLLATFEP
jgi:hypothetical protein